MLGRRSRGALGTLSQFGLLDSWVESVRQWPIVAWFLKPIATIGGLPGETILRRISPHCFLGFVLREWRRRNIGTLQGDSGGGLFGHLLDPVYDRRSRILQEVPSRLLARDFRLILHGLWGAPSILCSAPVPLGRGGLSPQRPHVPQRQGHMIRSPSNPEAIVSLYQERFTASRGKRRVFI